MKVKVSTRRKKKVKDLHSTVQQNISKQSSESSFKGIAGKIRSLSVVLSDIAKDKDILTHQGWESVGHGIWKLKCEDFQHATRHIRQRRRTSLVESVTVVTDLKAKRHVGDGQKTQNSFDSDSKKMFGIPVNEQGVHALKLDRESGASIAPQGSKVGNEGIEKSIKVNLLRQKIGPSGEMGWRVRRRESFQMDSISPDSTRVLRRLSIEVSESDSVRKNRSGKIENMVNSGDTLASVSLGHDTTKEGSNGVVLRSFKRRSDANHSTQDISGPFHTRKTRRMGLINSTKEQVLVDSAKNEKVGIVSNSIELAHSSSTKGNGKISSGECLKDVPCSDSRRPSKNRAVQISPESETLTRLRRSIKKENKSNDIPNIKNEERNKTVGIFPKLATLTSGERKSPRISLNLENERQNFRIQESAISVQSDMRSLRKNRQLEGTLKGSDLQKQAINKKTKVKKVKDSSIVNNKNGKLTVRVKKPQKLIRSTRKDFIPEKRLKRVVKQEINGAENNSQPQASKGSDDINKKVRIPRKRSNKVQLEWCSYCGLQLDSVENRLEHEFSHQEPRELKVSLHLCSLNSTSVKLPVYVDLNEVAALKSPQVEDYSPDVNENRLLLDVKDVLNEDEYEAYDDAPDGIDEDGGCNQEGSISNNDESVSTVSEPIQIEENEIRLNSNRKAKEKAHVKMRLWVKSQPRNTRSSRSEKQLLEKLENNEECPSLMVADFVSDDVLPAEDGLHDYVEVVVDKGSPGRIIADDETIKDVNVSTTDGDDFEASKTAELSTIDKDTEESLREETGIGSKDFEENPEMVPSPAMENSDINSNEILIVEHNFSMQESEKPEIGENYDVGIMEGTGHNMEVNAMEAEDEVIENLVPKINEISNEIDEDDIKSSDPKLSEINNDNMEDEMEDIDTDLCKVDCGNIEDDMENLNANFREMNDGIVGEIIGLDPADNGINSSTVRSKNGSLDHNSCEIDHAKIVDGIEISSHKERKEDENLDTTLNKISIEATENSVENELESLDRKLTEINKQQDEEERRLLYSNMAVASSKNIQDEAKNKGSFVDITENCIGNIAPVFSEFVDEAMGGASKLESSPAAPKSNTSTYSPEDLISAEENENKVCNENLDPISTEISELTNKANSDDSQSYEASNICTEIAKVNEHEPEDDVEDSISEQMETGSKVVSIENNLEGNVDKCLKIKTTVDDSGSHEVGDICTDIANLNEPGDEVEDSVSEPIETDSKVDGVEDDIHTEIDNFNEPGDEVEDSVSEPIEADSKVDGVEVDIHTDIANLNELEDEVEDSVREPIETDSKVDGVEDDIHTEINNFNEPGDEVEDSVSEPIETDSKVDDVKDVLEVSVVSCLKFKTKVDYSESHEVSDIHTEIANLNEPGDEVEDFDSEPIETDSKVNGVVDDLEGSIDNCLEIKTNVHESLSNGVSDICTDMTKPSENEPRDELGDSNGELKVTGSKIDDVEDGLEGVSDEKDFKPKEVDSKIDRDMDGLEDISDGEFEPIDEQSPSQNIKDGVTCVKDEELDIESFSGLLGGEKVDRTASVEVGEKSNFVIEDDSKSGEEVVTALSVKEEASDDDEDDKDTVILDHGSPQHPVEVEDFIRLRGLNDDKIDGESRCGDQKEGEKEKNVTGIDSTDVFNESRVLPLNNNCIDGGTSLEIEHSEDEVRRTDNIKNLLSVK